MLSIQICSPNGIAQPQNGDEALFGRSARQRFIRLRCEHGVWHDSRQIVSHASHYGDVTTSICPVSQCRRLISLIRPNRPLGSVNRRAVAQSFMITKKIFSFAYFPSSCFLRYQHALKTNRLAISRGGSPLALCAQSGAAPRDGLDFEKRRKKLKLKFLYIFFIRKIHYTLFHFSERVAEMEKLYESWLIKNSKLYVADKWDTDLRAERSERSKISEKAIASWVSLAVCSINVWLNAFHAEDSMGSRKINWRIVRAWCQEHQRIRHKRAKRFLIGFASSNVFVVSFWMLRRPPIADWIET